jgi:hypothetical protein
VVHPVRAFTSIGCDCVGCFVDTWKGDCLGSSSRGQPHGALPLHQVTQRQFIKFADPTRRSGHNNLLHVLPRRVHIKEVRVGSNGGSELRGTTHREGESAAALRPISMARRRLLVLELLHGVEGKVAEETGARAWMRGKWGKKGTEGRLMAFQAARWRGAEREKGEGALGAWLHREGGGGKRGGLAWQSAA